MWRAAFCLLSIIINCAWPVFTHCSHFFFFLAQRIFKKIDTLWKSVQHCFSAVTESLEHLSSQIRRRPELKLDVCLSRIIFTQLVCFKTQTGTKSFCKLVSESREPGTRDFPHLLRISIGCSVWARQSPKVSCFDGKIKSIYLYSPHFLFILFCFFNKGGWEGQICLLFHFECSR